MANPIKRAEGLAPVLSQDSFEKLQSIMYVKQKEKGAACSGKAILRTNCFTCLKDAPKRPRRPIAAER